MSTFIEIASRVEAAVAAYTSVRDFSDQEKWRAEFRREFREARRIFGTNLKGGSCHPLHPTLVALSIVLWRNEDLGNINRFHPDREQHRYYDASAEFPSDISHLLPPSKDRWWEELAEAARREHTVSTTPSQPPPIPQQRIARSVPSPPGQLEEEDSEDAQMVVQMLVGEEFDHSQSHRRSKVAKGAAATRKRKVSFATSSEGAKRHAQSRQRPDSVEQHSGKSDADPVRPDSQALYGFTCDRCKQAGMFCRVNPEGPCHRCKTNKQGCSLMPVNPKTGKTDRHALTKAELFEFRIKQVEKRHAAEVKRGKQRVRNSPDAGKPKASAPIPSPLEPLTALGAEVEVTGVLALKRGRGKSSAAKTPADSPATFPEPPLRDIPALAPSKDPKARRASQFSGGFMAEAPSTSQSLNPAHRQALPLCNDASRASEGRSDAARIAGLERRLDDLMKLVSGIDLKLKKFGV